MPDGLRVHIRPALGDRRGPARRDRLPSVRALPPGLRRPDRQPHRRPSPRLARVAGDPELERVRGGLHRRLGRHPPRALGRPQPRDGGRRSLPFLRARRRQARLPARASRPRARSAPTTGTWTSTSSSVPAPARPSSTCSTTTARTSSCIPQWQAFLRERRPRDADPLGRERHLLHPRRRTGVPARPAGRRAAHARQRAFRRRGLARGDRRAHQALLRRDRSAARSARTAEHAGSAR